MGKLAIGSPVMRPLWLRILLTGGLCFLYTWKKLRLPRLFFGRQMWSIITNWTDPMFKILIKKQY